MVTEGPLEVVTSAQRPEEVSCGGALWAEGTGGASPRGGQSPVGAWGVQGATGKPRQERQTYGREVSAWELKGSQWAPAVS